MPLQLPPPLQFALHTTRPLQVPSDPPTADDVVRAALNAELVWGTHKIGGHVTEEEASAALVYEASVLSARAANADPAVAPPWFQAGMERIEARLNRIERMAAISHNRAALDGTARPFQEVPFPDGTSPTADHNLPLLHSLVTVQTLPLAQLKRYHRHYCPRRAGVDGRLARDTPLSEVLKEIGCDR